MHKLTASLLPNPDTWTVDHAKCQAARQVSEYQKQVLHEEGWTDEQIASLKNYAQAAIALRAIAERGIDK